ncbi:ACL193Cp [Eremothecium gossypii ATCC 10895]|uniref:ACL193Cp n=1 Tax=Eremothecium gossypii (strain ATCC 10895 / CBS 109.51 / FGSC 9923 / NRRL Y-1056) TaxID=284811 RepID=Q75CV9_EREGS|nr:ACL193Cp [Eremothecium gossypii ATCC 10895]AAS51035.1 ACL193Cp [Eremothecium gossypii ATCC 10895]
MSYIRSLLDQQDSQEDSTDPETNSSTSSAGSGLLCGLQHSQARRTDSFFRESFNSPKATARSTNSPPKMDSRVSVYSQAASGTTLENDQATITQHSRPFLPALMSSSRTLANRRSVATQRDHDSQPPQSGGSSSMESTHTQVPSPTDTLLSDSRSPAKSISSRGKPGLSNYRLPNNSFAESLESHVPVHQQNTSASSSDNMRVDSHKTMPGSYLLSDRIAQEPIEEEQESDTDMYTTARYSFSSKRGSHMAHNVPYVFRTTSNWATLSTAPDGSIASLVEASNIMHDTLENEAKASQTSKSSRHATSEHGSPQKEAATKGSRISLPLQSLRSKSDKGEHTTPSSKPKSRHGSRDLNVHSKAASASPASGLDSSPQSSAMSSDPLLARPQRSRSKSMDSADYELQQIYQYYEYKGIRRHMMDLEKGCTTVRETDSDQFSPSQWTKSTLFSIPRVMLILFFGLFIPPLLFMIGGGTYSGVSDRILIKMIIHKAHRHKADRGYLWDVDVRWFRRLAIAVGVVELLTIIALIGVGFGLGLATE